MPDDIKISALTNVNTLSDTAVFPMVQDLNGTDTTLKASMSQVAGKVAEGTTFVNLTTTAKDLVGAINEAASTGGSVDITTEITTPAPIMTFNDGGDNIPLKSLVTEIVPIQASGTPSPSNPLPISGHNSITVNNIGKYHRIIPTSLTPQTSNGITVTPKSDGTFDVSGTATANSTVNFAFDSYVIYSDDGRKVGFNNTFADSAINISFRNGTTQVDGWSVSPTNKVSGYSGMAGKTIDNFNFFVPLGKTVNGSFRIEFYIDSTVQTPVTISLGQTVYGGSLECVEGNGQVTKAYVEFDGSSDETWNRAANGAFYINAFTDTYWGRTKISNMYVYGGEVSSSAGVTEDKTFYAQYSESNPAYCRLWIKDTDYATVTAFTTFLASNTLQVVYGLKTPIDLSVSGANIPTLSGTNNIYTDCGDIQSLEYFNENGDDIASMVRLMSKDYREVLLPKRVTASVSTITSSSHDGNYLDWCAFNGRTPSNLRNPDAYTCWSAAQNETNAWIAVDLGSVKDLYEVQLDVFSNYSGDWVGNIAVQGSNDNTNWTSILASGNANIGIVAPLQQITSTIIQVSGSYRYVRIVGIDKFTVYYNPSCFFDEIFIYAKE